MSRLMNNTNGDNLDFYASTASAGSRMSAAHMQLDGVLSKKKAAGARLFGNESSSVISPQTTNRERFPEAKGCGSSS